MSLNIQSAIRNVEKLLSAKKRKVPRPLDTVSASRVKKAASGADVEYIIWGIPLGEEHENVLHTKSKSMAEAKKIIKILEEEHGCTKCRVQVLDLTKAPDFSKIFSKRTARATSGSTRVMSSAKKTKILAMLGVGSKPNLRLLNKLVSRGAITADEVVNAVGEALFLKRVNKRVVEAITMALRETLGVEDTIDMDMDMEEAA